jgi:hypothetical protein
MSSTSDYERYWTCGGREAYLEEVLTKDLEKMRVANEERPWVRIATRSYFAFSLPISWFVLGWLIWG